MYPVPIIGDFHCMGIMAWGQRLRVKSAGNPIELSACALAGCDHPPIRRSAETEPQITNDRAARTRAKIDMTPPKAGFGPNTKPNTVCERRLRLGTMSRAKPFRLCLLRDNVRG